MKPEKKSAPFCAMFAIICCGLLQACALPTWFTGEPDERVLKAERAVGHAPSRGEEKGYPLLSSVPSAAPEDLSTPQDRAAKMDELNRDKEEAQKLRAQEAAEQITREPDEAPSLSHPPEN